MCPITASFAPLGGGGGGAAAPDRGPGARFVDGAADHCIRQGDVLTVEYTDPAGARGPGGDGSAVAAASTSSASAVFDLRSGTLESDRSVYVVGGDMVLTLTEPDLNLDSGEACRFRSLAPPPLSRRGPGSTGRHLRLRRRDRPPPHRVGGRRPGGVDSLRDLNVHGEAESYDLDLIEWESGAGDLTLGDRGGAVTRFDPDPPRLTETGADTGVFRAAVKVPGELVGGRAVGPVVVAAGPAAAGARASRAAAVFGTAGGGSRRARRAGPGRSCTPASPDASAGGFEG